MPGSPTPLSPLVGKKSKKSKTKDSVIVIENESLAGIKGLFLGNYEDRRKFGVSEIMSTLGISVRFWDIW